MILKIGFYLPIYHCAFYSLQGLPALTRKKYQTFYIYKEIANALFDTVVSLSHFHTLMSGKAGLCEFKCVYIGYFCRILATFT